jgi:hypothetical protein
MVPSNIRHMRGSPEAPRDNKTPPNVTAIAINHTPVPTTPISARFDTYTLCTGSDATNIMGFDEIM